MLRPRRTTWTPSAKTQYRSPPLVKRFRTAVIPPKPIETMNMKGIRASVRGEASFGTKSVATPKRIDPYIVPPSPADMRCAHERPSKLMGRLR